MDRTRVLPVVVALAALVAALPTGARACGDKFLVIGRTAPRVQKARHPGTILLAMRADDATLAAAVRSMKLAATLEKAGHTVETMPAPASLTDVLAARRYDFIVTGVDGAAAMARETASVASPPEVVPVSLATDAAGQAEDKAYGLVIHARSRSLAYLAALDAAMARRRKP